MRPFLIAVAIGLIFTPRALAQPRDAANWPTRPIHLIVPFPAGSSPDLIARILAEKLPQSLGQAVVVENRPGAGGNLGTGLVAKAAPDGYTIGLSIPGPLAVNTVLYRKMEYDPFKDLAPVSLVGASPNLLVVDPKLNISSMKEFVALAKSQPGKLNYGSAGDGDAAGAVGPAEGARGDDQRAEHRAARISRARRGGLPGDRLDRMERDRRAGKNTPAGHRAPEPRARRHPAQRGRAGEDDPDLFPDDRHRAGRPGEPHALRGRALGQGDPQDRSNRGLTLYPLVKEAAGYGGKRRRATLEQTRTRVGRTSNESNSMNQIDGSILMLAVSLPAARMGSWRAGEIGGAR